MQFTQGEPQSSCARNVAERAGESCQLACQCRPYPPLPPPPPPPPPPRLLVFTGKYWTFVHDDFATGLIGLQSNIPPPSFHPQQLDDLIDSLLAYCRKAEHWYHSTWKVTWLMRCFQPWYFPAGIRGCCQVSPKSTHHILKGVQVIAGWSYTTDGVGWGLVSTTNPFWSLKTSNICQFLYFEVNYQLNSLKMSKWGRFVNCSCELPVVTNYTASPIAYRYCRQNG